MHLSPAELIEKLTRSASRFVSEPEARYFAEETVEAHLRKSPRTSPLEASIGDLEATAKRSGEEISCRTNLPGFVSFDFRGHGPLTYLKRIHDDLEERSGKNGIAMAAFTNSQSMHTLHTWVQWLAKRGLLAIAVCNGGPGAVVPLYGTKGLFGTNPIAYGLPGANGEIHCIDMATSEIPYFEILDAHKRGEPLRERSAVDNTGEFTTDASKALDFSESETDPFSSIVPMGGGYKGYYIVYLMEILTSALIGMPSSPEMSADFVPEEHGAILIVFNPKAMGTAGGFAASVGALHAAIKGQKAKAGETVNVPGELNTRRLGERKGKKIEVEEELWGKLDKLA